MSRLGVEAITGKPYKPTTQGKNERFHQTLFRYLDKQPLAETLAELQAQVDAFDHIYNTERPHQGLPGRVTPLTAWEATAKAEPPRPKPDRPPSFDRPVASRDPPPSHRRPPDLPADTRVKKLSSAGTFYAGQGHLHGRRDNAASSRSSSSPTATRLTVTDLDGEILTEHTRPAPGSHLRRQRPTPRPTPQDP